MIKKDHRLEYMPLEHQNALISALGQQISAMDSQNRTNIALLRFVLPTLKAVEIQGNLAPTEIIISFTDED